MNGAYYGPPMTQAYYGPPIPPPNKAYYHGGGRRRSGGGPFCCMCNPFLCCCRCIFDCVAFIIMQILCTLLVMFCVFCIVSWLLFQPQKVDFTVVDASLTKFDFTPDKNTLIYDLSLNVTIDNTNEHLDVEYYAIQAAAFYENVQFANVELNPFFQPVENVSSVQPVFRGQTTVPFGDMEVYRYIKDKNSGMYNIDVKLYLKMRFKSLQSFQSPKFKPTIDCDMKIPLNVDGKSSGQFQHTECSYYF